MKSQLRYAQYDGYEAGMQGQEMTDNPFESNSPEYEAWEHGWLDAVNRMEPCEMHEVDVHPSGVA